MRFWTRLSGATAAVAIVAISAMLILPVVRAQEGGAAPAEGKDGPQAFLERVAAQLGIDATRLEEAIKGAQLQIVDEALADGRIDESQAAKARERIESGKGFGLRRLHERHHRLMRLRQAFISEAADAIGVTREELRAELKAGKSVAAVAEEHGVSIDTVKQSILDGAQAKLNEAVANGRIDQATSGERMAQLTERIDELLQRTRQ